MTNCISYVHSKKLWIPPSCLISSRVFTLYFRLNEGDLVPVILKDDFLLSKFYFKLSLASRFVYVFDGVFIYRPLRTLAIWNSFALVCYKDATSWASSCSSFFFVSLINLEWSEISSIFLLYLLDVLYIFKSDWVLLLLFALF